MLKGQTKAERSLHETRFRQRSDTGYLWAIISQPVRCLISATRDPTRWIVSELAIDKSSPFGNFPAASAPRRSGKRRKMIDRFIYAIRISDWRRHLTPNSWKTWSLTKKCCKWACVKECKISELRLLVPWKLVGYVLVHVLNEEHLDVVCKKSLFSPKVR